jgi:hypothetical protein
LIKKRIDCIYSITAWSNTLPSVKKDKNIIDTMSIYSVRAWPRLDLRFFMISIKNSHLDMHSQTFFKKAAMERDHHVKAPGISNTINSIFNKEDKT